MESPNVATNTKQEEPQIQSTTNVLKFIIYSLIGSFMFFIPITINGVSSIPIDHIVTWIKVTLPSAVPIYALIVILLGGVYPFISKSWSKDKVSIVFSLLKVLGAVVAILIYFKIGPEWLMAPSMGPFLFEKLVIPVGLVVPLGAIFLALLIGYGLLEFLGVLMQPIMRPIFKTPGRSAVDMVADLAGSYSIGMLITNRLYKEGKYTLKEAAIIATGFSTVSATFMIVVAKTLGLMDLWSLFFWVSLGITYLVTAITVRIWPLNKMSDEYYSDNADPEEVIKEGLFRNAWNSAMVGANNSVSLGRNLWENLKDGFLMTMSILPSILSVGLISLVLAEYTPIFNLLGYLFYPFTWALQIPEPFLAAKASAIGIAEMFLPALLVVDAPLVTKFIIAVVSVSSILFFSATIPCILSTEIPISITKLIVIWFERTLITLIITAPIAILLL
ncbi:YjiH family protein [Peribacillus frigoritolerans]|uniref:YjiH family protein n=1 Tax=Peribacillus frigoritolerans TaxID=450367 RepID=UPI0021CEF576|nr:YjiH family protein [Peribacillus frigoritolerans]MCU6600729.1 YjiH family protein [Peribacillus frigoritolerans]